MQLSPSDQQKFAACAAVLSHGLAQQPPELRQLAEENLTQLLAGEFSQLAALLPIWLSDLAPLSPEMAHTLGVAGLYSWWYGQIIDDILDEAVAPILLPVAQHALMGMLNYYQRLGCLCGPSWANIVMRSNTSVAAYARELSSRSTNLTELSDAQLAHWTPELLMDRAAPFGFLLEAQLNLAGIPDDDDRRESLPTALRWFTGARQICDDAGDWQADLQKGQLNYASAQLIRYFRQHAEAASEISLERLVGYQAGQEAFWAELEATHAACCAQALGHLAPYGESRLRSLVLHQQQKDGQAWGNLRAYRVRVRGFFGF